MGGAGHICQTTKLQNSTKGPTKKKSIFIFHFNFIFEIEEGRLCQWPMFFERKVIKKIWEKILWKQRMIEVEVVLPLTKLLKIRFLCFFTKSWFITIIAKLKSCNESILLENLFWTSSGTNKNQNFHMFKICFFLV